MFLRKVHKVSIAFDIYVRILCLNLLSNFDLAWSLH
jgi:hypothetical protein